MAERAPSDPNPSDQLETAVADHRAGRLAEAQRGYEAVLAADPANLTALLNLGLVRLQAKQLDRALPLLARAFRLAPADHPAWIGYAQGLIAAEQFNTASDLLARRGDAPQAPALILRLHQAWGMALLAKGEDAAAAQHFRTVCELSPDDPDAHADLGLAELRQDRAAEAVESFQRALELAPDHLQALVNLGSALRRLERLDAAAESYRRALALQPDHAAAAHNLAGVLRLLGKTDELPQAAPGAPPVGGSPAALVLARGDALAERQRFGEALECYAAAAAQDPALRHRALVQTAAVQEAMGSPHEALATLNQAIALAPEDPEAHTARALLRLAMCDFAGGWADYEHRLRSEGFAPGGRAITWQIRRRLQADPAPEQLAGRRVLLIAEQGIGDEVMFASCIPDLAALAAELTCICEPRLQRLFARSFPGVQFLAAGAPAAVAASQADFDRLIAMGSLGRLFRNRIEAFPGAPYLRPAAEVGARWAARLGPRRGRLRVGISWRGGTPKTGAARRSLSLDQLAPVLDLPDCEFVSLQYGDAAAELAAANAGRAIPIRAFPAAEIDDFEELAGLLLGLDAVVSVQTSVVHLSGALGADCLALLPRIPEWRYTLGAPAMPWYGSVSLFRQAEAGAWEPVIGRVAQALRQRVGA